MYAVGLKTQTRSRAVPRQSKVAAARLAKLGSANDPGIVERADVVNRKRCNPNTFSRFEPWLPLVVYAKIAVTLRRTSRVTHLESTGVINALSYPWVGRRPMGNSKPINERYGLVTTVDFRLARYPAGTFAISISALAIMRR
jgi:hypothetical protein